jgi:N-acyl-D-aspartate/D-glutamate deacylase
VSENYDLVIRGGTVIDGTGRPGFTGDVGVRGGRIAAVGAVDGIGAEEIDATGRLVTPGFVDIHTHYDGHATWTDRLEPSSQHGVTTVLTGNCGVGFAPCRPEDRAGLIRLMEGVEDIPDVVMAAGLPWNWVSFPDYLDSLERRRFDMDVATQLPHAPLRVFVMGARAMTREPATAEEIARMRTLARDAMNAGALGFSTSRSLNHKASDGAVTPSYAAASDELAGIAGVCATRARACSS